MLERIKNFFSYIRDSFTRSNSTYEEDGNAQDNFETELERSENLATDSSTNAQVVRVENNEHDQGFAMIMWIPGGGFFWLEYQ